MTENVIELKDVSFSYPEAEVDALDHVNLSVRQGEWLAMIGPNGSGKSTCAKVINGLLVPYQGLVSVMGLVLSEETIWQARRHVGMVFQNPDNQFVGATVEDDVAFGLENIGIPREEMLRRIPEALAKVNMSAFAKHEPARLSGGQKQRVALASVMATRPSIVILDEATAMLDPQGRREMMEAMAELKKEFGLTVISITHDINEASRADRIIVMHQGKPIQQGNPEEIFALGEQLISLGLDIPFAQKLRSALEARGVSLPAQYMNEEALLEWLTTSYLTK
ncbi:energy-coupling factor ABC transporter ATP-binding protein [Ignavigranum ruoffiae]|uniref:Energy-coupling factor transport system ATP-binding protein n=1 Tax=Ignavigranum ruoffiae TaxID=89093 RepID=A0A1H9D5L8_9LACT|nr:energy-coupling factor ABC transporter ATP-binding protein [Ignavigranum ruoffiae]SEQ08679.1 energy-coupling factor transport system ATP-binding protein [Ignavigranum ruoffiae]